MSTHLFFFALHLLSIPDMINLMLPPVFIFSNLKSSLMIEFDDSLFLFYFFDTLDAGLAMNLTTRIFPSFLSYSSNYLSVGISSLILRSQMNPHVMYGNAVWFLGLSMGIGPHIF